MKNVNDASIAPPSRQLGFLPLRGSVEQCASAIFRATSGLTAVVIETDRSSQEIIRGIHTT